MTGPPRPERVVGRYAVYGEIASGGMATVHLGRVVGAAGFARTVAIKRMHPQYVREPDFVAMFTDEARLAARVQHPNVVATVDVVAARDELLLVMDYVHGVSLSRLLRLGIDRGERIPPEIVATIITSALHGLHAAHEARSERGQPLGLVHRDVSPQNVLVGADGVARVLDFGVAKAVGRTQVTREGQVKGKLGYMSPEQLHDEPLDRRSDVYAAGVVLWETLVGERLFSGGNEGAVLHRVLYESVAAPSTRVPGLPAGFDEVVLRAVDRDRSRRFASAREMALALERLVPLAASSEVGAWVERVAEKELSERAAVIAEIEEGGGLVMSPSGKIKRPSGWPRRSYPSMSSISSIREEPTTPELSAASTVDPGAAQRPVANGRTALVVALSLGIFAFVIAGVLVVRWQPADASSVASAPVVTASASALPEAASASPAVAPIAPIAPAAPVVSVESLPEKPSKKSKASARPAPPPTPAPEARPNCSPPYSVDEAGRKHFKRECL